MRTPQAHAPAIISVIVFILMRFRPSSLIQYVCVFVLIHFRERFQIGLFSMKTEGLNFQNWGRCLIVLHIIAFSQRGGRFWSSSGVFPSSRVWNVHQDGSSCTSADERLKRDALSMKWNWPTGHLHHNVYLTTTTRIDPSACSLTVLNIKWRFNVINTRIEMTKIIF